MGVVEMSEFESDDILLFYQCNIVEKCISRIKSINDQRSEMYYYRLKFKIDEHNYINIMIFDDVVDDYYYDADFKYRISKNDVDDIILNFGFV